jgi:hypothetical protein
MPNVQRQVERVVGNCLDCLKNKPKRYKPYRLL